MLHRGAEPVYEKIVRDLQEVKDEKTVLGEELLEPGELMRRGPKVVVGGEPRTRIRHPSWRERINPSWKKLQESRCHCLANVIILTNINKS